MNDDHLEWTGERLTTVMDGDIIIEHLHRYAMALRLAKHRSVLDIACGEGYGSNLLATVAQQVIGVDVSSRAVDFAKGKYRRPNLSFVQGSATEIPLADSSVDLVVSFETIEHLDEHERMLDEIKRVLRPTGMLIISSPDKLNYTDKTGKINKFHVKELYRQEFIELVQSKFTSTRFFSQAMVYGSLIVPDGHRHDGFWEFQGGFDRILENDGLASPMYNLCVASNGLVDESQMPHQSMFNAEATLARLRATGAEICASRTYRAGLLVTLPLRLIRRLFGSDGNR